MTLRTVLTLFIVAVGLTVYAVVFERGVAPWEGAGKVFPEIEPSNIVRLELRRRISEEERRAGANDAPIVLERRGENDWFILEPIEFSAFLPRVQGILWEIADMVQVTEVPPSSSDFQTWAPDGGPTIEVRFATDTGATHTIELGVAHPQIERDLYARIDGEDGRVIVSRASARTAFTATVGELRSRALVPVAPQDCVHFSVRGSGARVTKSMSREVGSTRWRFDKGTPLEGHLVDRELLFQALHDINSWGVDTFEDGLKDGKTLLEERGLSKPELVLQLHHRRGDRVILEIGKTFEKEGEKRVYVRRPSDGAVFTAKREPVAALWLEPEELRTRYVLDLEGEEITQLDCVSVEGRFTVRKEVVSVSRDQGVEDEERWVVEDQVRGETFAADEIQLAGAISELRQVLIEKFLSGDAAKLPDSETGPQRESPSITVTLTNRSQETMVFHGPAAGEEDAKLGVWVASRSGDDAVFLVNSQWPQRLLVGSYVFRDRSISDLSPATVKGATITAGRQSWDLLGIGHWGFSADQHVVEGRELDQSLINEVIQSLHADRFRVFSFAPELAKERYDSLGIGTVAPHSRIALKIHNRHHKGFRTLSVGTRQVVNRRRDLHFARCDAFDVPFTILPDVPKRLTKLIEHLRWVTGETGDDSTGSEAVPKDDSSGGGARKQDR